LQIRGWIRWRNWCSVWTVA